MDMAGGKTAYRESKREQRASAQHIEGPQHFLEVLTIIFTAHLLGGG